ncbi:MAG TPA: radical SAM family heme chaperone HemW [Woeseiaceae bacterium]|nr:radical SAM family heme chaperone HemW [Woeseiaceae bacterium]
MPSQAPPPLSLYVHLPWCVQKCPYCDFNSYAGGDDASRRRYLDAICRDIEAEVASADGRPLVSIFLGGGTPSLFRAAEIGRLLDLVRAQLACADDIEITMEANPGAVERGDLRGYRDAGVNRLSIGAQSFDSGSLAALGRIHGVEDIGMTVAEAADAGFDDINIDIMYALPGQDVALALADIDAAASLEPTHLSWYQLTLEPNTVFYARPPRDLPDEDLSFAIQEAGEARLAELGFERYEVSAWARGGRRCRHNLNYWSFGDYLAAGAGAHGKLTTPDGIVRYRKPANPLQYMQQMEARGETCGEPGAIQTISDGDLLFEFMLNALRLVDGFDERLFVERTRLPLRALRERLLPLETRGLVAGGEGGHWRPTPKGRQFLNDLQAHFLPD